MNNKIRLASIAGELLDKKYVKPLVKSIAGSGLKCFGDNGTPSIKVKDKAKMVVTANRKAPGYLYTSKEVLLAEGILAYRGN
jgi:hypothetical protein